MTISPKNLSMFNNQLSIVIQNEKAPGAPPPQGPFPSLLRHHHSVPRQPTSCPFGIHPQGELPATGCGQLRSLAGVADLHYEILSRFETRNSSRFETTRFLLRGITIARYFYKKIRGLLLWQHAKSLEALNGDRPGCSRGCRRCRLLEPSTRSAGRNRRGDPRRY